jgi:hypothetical protein
MERIAHGGGDCFLPIYLFMTANIEKDDLPVGNHNGKGDAKAVSDAHSLNAFNVSTELVIFQVWLERIFFEFTKYGCKLSSQIGMTLYELLG